MCIGRTVHEVALHTTPFQMTVLLIVDEGNEVVAPFRRRHAEVELFGPKMSRNFEDRNLKICAEQRWDPVFLMLKE